MRILHKSCADGIVKDVVCDGVGFLGPSDDAFMEPGLPEAPAAMLPICERGALPCKGHGGPQIVSNVGALQKPVHVVGHEDPRKQIEAAVCERAVRRLADDRHRGFIEKQLPFPRTACNEVSMTTEVVKSRKALRTHARCTACVVPLGSGRAKARPYVRFT